MVKIISYNIYKFDLFLFQYIFGWNGKKLLDKFFYYISRSGDGYLYGLLGPILLIMGRHTAIKTLLAALIAFAIELPVHGITKKLTKRIRPFEKLGGISNLIAAPDKYSFPSGHTAAAFLMVNILSFLAPQLFFPLLGWAILVAISRIYLGVHYPTDVIAGCVLGMVTSNFGIWLVA